MNPLYNDRVLHEWKHVSLVSRESTKGGSYEQLVRNKVAGIISVLPITTNQEVILTREFRIPVWGEVLWIPAGLMDEEGEDPVDTVRRELREETGYDSQTITFACRIAPSPGATSEVIHCYIAEDAFHIGWQDLQWEEDITIETLPFNTLRTFLRKEELSWVLINPQLRMLASIYEDILQERGIK